MNTFCDPHTSRADRAIALCWILHLFADGHQPCHAGSLYAPVFPKGDRGGNAIELSDGSNLHAAWDKLLGGYPSANEVRRRVQELGDVRRGMTKNVPPLTLTPNYYRNAGELARYRIKQAGYRVGAVLVRSLQATERAETVTDMPPHP